MCRSRIGAALWSVVGVLVFPLAGRAIAPSEPAWTPDVFALQGMDKGVRAFCVFDDGSGSALYAGGQFTIAGSEPANCVAKWNGKQWLALGLGMGGPNPGVYALTTFDDGRGPALYAGGSFISAGGGASANVARWGCQTAWADFDRDADVDLGDFEQFLACFNGPNRTPASAECDGADLDRDRDVDLADFLRFQARFNGPDRPPACP
jgi:hypothetical protein